jgi:nucleotide-binding universal stress UspA family protein
MGTLGKTGFDRFLLGSVAEKVTRNSKVPVLVVRGDSEKEE